MTPKLARVPKEESPQNSTEITESFKPTPAMLKWFDTAIELGHTASITEIALKSELDRKNWYLWMDKPGFVDWWDAEWGRYIKSNRWKLDAMGMKQAERSFDYWKTMMERTGNITSQPSIVNPVQINFNSKKYIKR